jgi:dTDP-4-dehydrorhamnose 3,5-epimerase
MKFRETPLVGAWIIELEPIKDERGFFARSWCRNEWLERGLNPHLVQCNIVWNCKRGTLRGMHWQDAPHAEAKLVRCTRGAIYDVILDLRPASPTWKQWFAIELSALNRTMLYIPEGFAHGLQTLQDDSEVFYQMSEEYHPESARGVRWNDPAFGIEWPDAKRIIAARDAAFPDYEFA